MLWNTIYVGLVPPGTAGSPFGAGITLAEAKARGGRGLPWVSASCNSTTELGTADAVGVLRSAGQEQGGMAGSGAQEPGELPESGESSIKAMAWALTPASHQPEEGQEGAKHSSQN